MQKIKNNKRIIYAFLCLTAISIPTIFALINRNSFSVFGDENTWIHYAKREATSYQDGIREYWIQCGGGYTFNKPSSSNIIDAEAYDTSEFTTYDPRWIKYVPDSKAVFYIEETSSYNFSEYLDLNGYTPKEIPSALGSQIRTEFTKNNSSPTYVANIMRVTNVINSNSDLKTLQDKLDVQCVGGYYVLSADLNKPNTYVNTRPSATAATFKGTFDGRNHTITNPTFWGVRMLGGLENAVVKNLNFKEISVFSTVCYTMTDSIIDNVNFEMSSTLNSYSNVGMICDAMYGSSQIKNSYIDFGEHYHLHVNGNHQTAPIAAYNLTNKDNQVFDNVSIRCLSTVNLFLKDSYNRPLRPTEGITYITPSHFIQNGVSSYSIQYLESSSGAKAAAEYIKSGIYRATGKTLSLSSFTSSTSLNKDSTSIILGGDEGYIDNCYGIIPPERGGYLVKAIGKAVFIISHDDTSYQAAAIKFMEKVFGYDHIAGTIYTNTVKDKNNLDLPPLNIEETTPFDYRRCDWGDGGFSDTYANGYNSIGYTSSDVYFNAPAVSGDSHLSSPDRFHTMIRFLHPSVYLSTHPNWYATDSGNNQFSLIDGSYYAWQLCFTAHGNANEYDQMVQTMANKVINTYNYRENKSSNVLTVTTMDSRNRCSCSSCLAKENEYGAISGTMIKFINDVNAKVEKSLGVGKCIITTFAYLAYKDAPIKNNVPTIHSDVPIILAPIEANFTYPIYDETYNSETKSLFEKWSQVGELYSWLYETNFSNYLYPYNSFQAMTESIKYMAEKGVKLAYIQGQHNLRPQKRTGFNQLKLYLDAKFMIDTNSNYNELVNKFFVNYYGPGYQKMRKFFDEMVSRMSQFDTNTTMKNKLYANGTRRSIYANIYESALWDYDQLQSWVSLCDEAMEMTDNEEIKNNILAESIFPRFCICTTFINSYSWVTAKQQELRRQFKTYADKLNITSTSEGNQTPLSTYYSNWGIA